MEDFELPIPETPPPAFENLVQQQELVYLYQTIQILKLEIVKAKNRIKALGG